MTFGPAELDLLSRAFYRALDRVGPHARDVEHAKTILMTGILHAARNGERDEDKLTKAALSAMLADEEARSAA
jgi:hypothetical protein